MATKIILQRHGESVANTMHIFAGWSDFPLSEKGTLQARVAAEALKNERIDAVYSSDLSRAYSTALPHAELRGITVEQRPALREINLGAWEAKTREYLYKNYPYEAGYIWLEYFGLFRAPDGESAPAAGERFLNELLAIAKENEGRTVLVAAHAAVIRLCWGRLLGYENHELGKRLPFSANASFSFLTYEDGRLIPERYSVDDHICGIGTEVPK